MGSGLSQFWVARYPAGWLAVIVCAFGRAADFATTWIALKSGHAIEAKAGAAQIFDALGPHTGLILYESLITTPLIFLGCYFVRRYCPARHDHASLDQPPARAEQMFFVSIGVISLIVAVHNAQFLF